MKGKSLLIGIIIVVVMAILWSIVFVNVLNSMAGMGVGICFGILGSLIFSKKGKNK